MAGEFLRLRNEPAGGQSLDPVDDGNPLPVKTIGLASLALGADGPIPVPPQYNSYFSVAQETKVVKTSTGVLHTIAIGKPLATGVITVYDGLSSTTGTLKFRITAPGTLLDGDSLFVLDIRFFVGLTIVTSGATQEVLFTYL